MKTIIIVAVVCSIIIVAFFKQAHFYPESLAKSIATSKFKHVCKETNVDPANYTGPYKLEPNENEVWGYEWRARIPQEKATIGIWIDASGATDVYAESKNL